MGVQLITPSLGAVAFAKNPVIFKLRSTDTGFVPYSAQGAQSKVTAGAGERFAAAETLTVTYTEPDGTSETVVFTASPTYTAEDEIPDDTFAGSITSYWETVRAKTQAHHRIAPYFTVTRVGPLGGNSLTFQSINSDPDWTITLANTAGFAIVDTAATADTTPANYSVLFEVFFERTYKGGDYVLVAQLKNTPDTDGYMWFDISSILESECQASLASPAVPEWSDADTMAGNNLRRYYIRFTEEYGTPVVPQEWEYDDVRVCMNGGVSQTVFAGGDYLSGLDAAASLLTWMPDGRKIGMTQPEWLAFYNFDTVERTVYVQMKWYTITNNDASTPASLLTPILLQPKEVALLPVNPTIMGLAAEDNAYKYSVQVVYDDTGSNVPVSQWRTYYIDRDYYHSERYVQYLNGFGVPDCWRCTGVWGKKLGVDRVIAERPLLPGYNEYATEVFPFRQTWDHDLIYNTGFVKREEADTLQEMLIAGEVYDVGPYGYIPLRLTSNSFAVTDTDEDLHAYKFTAVPRLSARNYSRQAITSPTAGAWQDPGGEAWFDEVMLPWEEP